MPTKYEEFNPLSLESLAQSVVDGLMRQGIHPLPPEHAFAGSGIYAIYYCGDVPPYESMPEFNDPAEGRLEQPIYVGKAVPKGSRKGGVQFDAGRERSIYNRLREHSRSITAVSKLDIADFSVRFLVVAPVWIQLAERLIILECQPVWNAVVDGFGNHDPGRGRYDQEVSRWDALHPGRTFAERLQSPSTFDVLEVMEQVRAFLAN